MASLVKIEARLGKIEVVLAEQNAHLKDHLRRTDKLEKSMGHVDTHVKRVQGGAKILAVLLAAIGSVIGSFKLFIN